jgi:hypothetical protein
MKQLFYPTPFDNETDDKETKPLNHRRNHTNAVFFQDFHCEKTSSMYPTKSPRKNRLAHTGIKFATIFLLALNFEGPEPVLLSSKNLVLGSLRDLPAISPYCRSTAPGPSGSGSCVSLTVIVAV